MTPLTDEDRLFLELYADGEIDDADRVRVEAWLSAEGPHTEYLAQLREFTPILRTPIECATERARFEGLLARIDGVLDTAPAPRRNAELEMHAMALADHETVDPAVAQRVRDYLAATPAAESAFRGIAETRDLLRLPIEQATERADFASLAARLDARIDALEREQAAARAPAPAASLGVFAAIAAWFGAHRGVLASGLAAAAATAVVLAVSGPSASDSNTPADEMARQPTVINNYYIAAPVVDSMEYERGFWGSVSPGDREHDIAPVVWFEPEAAPAESPSDLPL